MGYGVVTKAETNQFMAELGRSSQPKVCDVGKGTNQRIIFAKNNVADRLRTVARSLQSDGRVNNEQ